MENKTYQTLIKEWLKQQPHLPDSWNEQWIETYLRKSDFSLEKCKKKIDSYFTMKNTVPEFFSDRDVSKLKTVSKFVHMAVLPGLMTPSLYKVGIISSIDTSYEGYNLIDVMKVIFMGIDARSLAGDDGSVGDVCIFDYSHAYCLTVLKQITVSLVKAFVVSGQTAFPVRIKGVHYINTSPVFHTVIGMAKPFLKEKIRNRIHFHLNLESLHKHVPKEMLPQEYGGNAGTMASLSDEFWVFLEKHQDWFRKTQNVKADETKRPEKATNRDQLFGTDGSFRQLNID